ncbi:MAG: hypothetical protein ACYDDI_01410 [Candidatus Acidiferrales bacterium]
MTSGAGGYALGRLIENQTEKLSPIQVKNLLGLVNIANFWKLPTEDKNAPRGKDGAEWILEGIQHGNYAPLTVHLLGCATRLYLLQNTQ